jgi:hypothetical protein
VPGGEVGFIRFLVEDRLASRAVTDMSADTFGFCAG